MTESVVPLGTVNPATTPARPPLKRDGSWAWKDSDRIETVFAIGSGQTRFRAYPHQMEAVKLVLEAMSTTQQRRFLHYYAPRTGKTYIQAALAYFMSRIKDLKVSLIVVVNDRDFLDTQSFEVIENFLTTMKDAQKPLELPAKTRIVRADSVSDLAKEVTYCKDTLAKGETTILFTTLQKFSSKEITECGCLSSPELAERTLVMPDEVHRSHKDMGAYTLALENALGERLVKDGLLYFALTGTPSLQALERFGSVGPGGLLRPFHTFHLGQAISEGLVMDPRTEYNEVESLLDGIELDNVSAEQCDKLRRIYTASPGREQLQERVRLVMEHFTPKQAALKYQAQAMVLCNGREEVVRATEYARQVVTDKKLALAPESIMGAFSGTVTDNGRKLTEKELNGQEMKSSEDAKKARLLFVAHKFETGYDNSSLTFLYIFRRVCDSKALATQVMLRHCGKRGGKIRPVTLDFGSSGGEILSSISLYFGDVAAHGGVLHQMPSSKGSAAHSVEEGGVTRKAIEELIVGRLQLKGLEIKHIGAAGKEDSDLTVFRPAKRQRVQSTTNKNASTTGNPHTDLLLLMLLRDSLGKHEEAAFRRIKVKATQHYVMTAKGKLRAKPPNKKSLVMLSGFGAVSAMRQVLLYGDNDAVEDTMAILDNLHGAGDVPAGALHDFMLKILGSDDLVKLHMDAIAKRLQEKAEYNKLAVKFHVVEKAFRFLGQTSKMAWHPLGQPMNPDSSLHQVCWNALEAIEEHAPEMLPVVAKSLLKVKKDLQKIKAAKRTLPEDTAALVQGFPNFKGKAADRKRILKIVEERLHATALFEEILCASCETEKGEKAAGFLFTKRATLSRKAAEKALQSLKQVSLRAGLLAQAAATVAALNGQSNLTDLQERQLLQVVNSVRDIGNEAAAALGLREALAKHDVLMQQQEQELSSDLGTEGSPYSFRRKALRKGMTNLDELASSDCSLPSSVSSSDLSEAELFNSP